MACATTYVGFFAMERIVKTFAVHIRYRDDMGEESLREAIQVLDERVNATSQALVGLELRGADAIRDTVLMFYGEDFLVRMCVYRRCLPEGV